MTTATATATDEPEKWTCDREGLYWVVRDMADRLVAKSVSKRKSVIDALAVAAHQGVAVQITERRRLHG